MVEIKDQIHLRFTKDFSLNMSSDKNLKDYFFQALGLNLI